MIELLKIPNYFECIFIRRKNRFVVEIIVKGKIEEAHTNNTGRLKDFFIEGNKCFSIPIKGKSLTYRIFAFGEEEDRLSVIDTSLHMKAFEKMIEKGILKEFYGFDFRRNPRCLNSTFDYILKKEDKEVIVEVKSAVMRREDFALYPDAPSVRGERHLKDLIKLKRKGKETMLLFISSLPSVRAFMPNAEISPGIVPLLKEAYRNEVIIKSINILFSSKKGIIYLDNKDLPINLKS